MRKKLLALLEHPFFYQLCTGIFAPGAIWVTVRKIKRLIPQLPKVNLMLDVGCGPDSRLFKIGLSPWGVDNCPAYLQQYLKRGSPVVLASAQALPFGSNSFEGIWSFVLVHHLSDSEARETLKEFIRVCASPGYVVIMDWVKPRSRWRFLARIIQSLDRGGFIRTQTEMEALLPERSLWKIERFTYSATGLEMVVCWYVKR